MGKWKGTIVIDNKKIEVTVDYIKPGINNHGEWNGYGYCDSGVSLETYNTCIGTIVVNHIKVGPGQTYFTFKGSGIPEGELKKYID